MTNWIIVGIAIVIAAFLVGAPYQPVSAQGLGVATVCVQQGCLSLGELLAELR